MGLPLVIGIGNRWRCDDAAGVIVAERLADLLPAHPHSGEPASLIALWEGADHVVLIDAVSAGEPPGTIIEIDAVATVIPAGIVRSTHGMGPAEAIALARVLGTLPNRLTFYGIEGAEYGDGKALSPAVAAAIDRLVEMIADA